MRPRRARPSASPRRPRGPIRSAIVGSSQPRTSSLASMPPATKTIAGGDHRSQQPSRERRVREDEQRDSDETRAAQGSLHACLPGHAREVVTCPISRRRLARHLSRRPLGRTTPGAVSGAFSASDSPKRFRLQRVELGLRDRAAVQQLLRLLDLRCGAAAGLRSSARSRRTAAGLPPPARCSRSVMPLFSAIR